MSRIADLDEFLEDDDIEFPGDDWEYGYVSGKEAERERIIKLMEEEVRYDFPPIIEMSLDSFIALIKGEQK